MFKSIKTSKANKAIITQLTRKYNLGAENVIARIALAYSLEHGGLLDLKDLQDSGGKEYSKSVLLGDKEDIYIGIICIHYDLNKTHPDIPKYLKMHIDQGLEGLSKNHLKGSIVDNIGLTNE